MARFCPTCGKELQFENAEICPNCGVRIQAPPPPPAEVRNPWVAVILSFLFTGWGHWYCGKTGEGLKYFGIVLISYICGLVLAGVSSGSPALAVLVVPAIILFLVMLGAWIYAMYDAYMTADRINRKEVAFSGKSGLFWLPVALILLAFITILLAAVIAAFVFGMAGNVS